MAGGFEPAGLGLKNGELAGVGGGEAGFFAEFADGGLFGGFAGIDEAGGKAEVIPPAAGTEFTDKNKTFATFADYENVSGFVDDPIAGQAFAVGEFVVVFTECEPTVFEVESRVEQFPGHAR